MTSATTIKEEPAISIDKSKTYEINAGQCQHCGNYKTWQFRVKNPKSGKMMPGHVTAEGFKINDGDCPYWAAIRAKKQAKSKNVPAKIPGSTNASKGTLKVKPAKVERGLRGLEALSISKSDGNHAIIELSTKPPTRITISKGEAKELVFRIASIFA